MMNTIWAQRGTPPQSTPNVPIYRKLIPHLPTRSLGSNGPPGDPQGTPLGQNTKQQENSFLVSLLLCVSCGPRPRSRQYSSNPKQQEKQERLFLLLCHSCSFCSPCGSLAPNAKQQKIRFCFPVASRSELYWRSLGRGPQESQSNRKSKN